MIGPLSGRVLEAASKFGLYALAARLLGGDAAGAFFLCLGVIHFTATAARLGLERPVTRHVAAELAAGHPRRAREVAVRGLSIIAVSSVIVALGLSGLAHALAVEMFHGPALARALILSALIVPLQNLAYGSAYVLIGLGRASAAQLVMNALAPTLALTALLCGVRALEPLLVAYAVSFGGCALLGLLLVMKAWPQTTPSAAESSTGVMAMLFASARPLYVVELSQAALLSLPVVIIGHAASARAVSAFSLANRLSMLVTTVVLSVGAVAAPAFAAHHRMRAWAALKAVHTRTFRMAAGVCVPMIAVLALAAAPLLRFLGAGSAEAVQTMWILLVGQLVFCLLPCQDTFLAMTGHGGVLRRLSLFQLAACFALTLWLTPLFGVRGAAAASAAVWIIGAVGCALAARRVMRNLEA